MLKLDLDNLISIVRRITIQCPPLPDEDFLTYALATEVLRIYFGKHWTNENLFKMHTDVSRRNRAGRGFLKTESVVDADKYRHQQRILQLAETIYNLQETGGIEKRIADILAGNLESTTAELECAGQLYRAAIPFNFVDPRGEKGKDYDMEILLSNSRKIYCEVKSKSEDTQLREKTILDRLKHSQSQLPKDRPGLVFMKIPESWVIDPDVAGILEKTVRRFFGQTSRVIAVIFRWEEYVWNQRGQGAAIYNKFKIEKNTRGKHFNPATESVLDQIINPRKAKWISFRSIARFS